MPNNIVFNDIASQLKTTIYGSENVALKTDSEGRLEILSSLNFTTTNTSTSCTETHIFEQDTSNLTEYSFYVQNTGADTLAASIYISPTTDYANSLADEGVATLTLAQNETGILVPTRFLKYTGLSIDPENTSATFNVYFNGH